MSPNWNQRRDFLRLAGAGLVAGPLFAVQGEQSPATSPVPEDGFYWSSRK